MKKTYAEPVLNVAAFIIEDVVTTSITGGEAGGGMGGTGGIED